MNELERSSTDASPRSDSSEPERRNVVLVTVDSLRADYCGFGGDDRGLTPAMDRLAESGLVFENAIAPGPSTLDAMPEILTGSAIPDVEPGAGVGDADEIAHHVRSRGTIADRLSGMGYETGGFSANPWTSRHFGFDSGFEYFEDFLEPGESDDGADERQLRFTAPFQYGLRLLRNWRESSKMFTDWRSFYDDVLAWVERASQPYFLWVFLVDVHMPYLPPADVRSRSLPTTLAANLWLYLGGHETGPAEFAFRSPLLDAYEDTIRYTDEFVDRLTTDLAADDPVVVVHADHGEEFGEHGIYGHGPNLSEETLRVPLLVANGPTGRIEEPFSLSNLPELVETLACDDDPPVLAEPVVRARNRDPKFAVRGRDWSYVVCPDGEEVTKLDGDDGRRRDERLDRARAEVASWRADERERRRIVDAAEAVADEHAL